MYDEMFSWLRLYGCIWCWRYLGTRIYISRIQSTRLFHPSRHPSPMYFGVKIMHFITKSPPSQSIQCKSSRRPIFLSLTPHLYADDGYGPNIVSGYEDHLDLDVQNKAMKSTFRLADQPKNIISTCKGQLGSQNTEGMKELQMHIQFDWHDIHIRTNHFQIHKASRPTDPEAMEMETTYENQLRSFQPPDCS